MSCEKTAETLNQTIFFNSSLVWQWLINVDRDILIRWTIEPHKAPTFATLSTVINRTRSSAKWPVNDAHW